MMATLYTAWLFPGGQEWIVVVVVGLLLFGRRLPEVGRALGKTITEFRRGLNDFKRQIDSDSDFREAKSAVDDVRQTLHGTRELGDPKRLFDQLTDDSKSSAGPPDDSTSG